jgi:DNA polymerase
MLPLPLYSSLDQLREAAEACVACARADERQQVVFGSGAPHARLMLVGEAPSSTDDSTGRPFTGPAGRLLDELLAEHGLHRRDLWLTNLVRCYAGRIRDGRPENRPVKAGELAACATWLEQELLFINPRVILAVGAPAAKALIAKDFKLQGQRGQVFTRADGRLAIATLQPAYVMRLGNLVDRDAYQAARTQVSQDIELAARTAGLLDEGAQSD